MGVAAFDELNRFARGFGRCEENVDMIWHDNEAVEKKFACVAIAEEGGDKEFRVCRSLEVAMLLMGRDRNRVGLRLQPHRATPKENVPRGLKPFLFRV